MLNLNSEVQELLSDANATQLHYVLLQVSAHRTVPEACAALGLSRSAPWHWPNKDALDKAIVLLLKERIAALAAGAGLDSNDRATAETSWVSCPMVGR